MGRVLRSYHLRDRDSQSPAAKSGDASAGRNARSKHRRLISEHNANLNAAVVAVRQGGHSQRKAAKMYNVAQSTLNDRLNNRAKHKHGAEGVLAADEEQFLVETICHFSDAQLSLTLREFRRLVLAVFPGRVHGRNRTRFKASVKWVYKFLERHRDSLGYARCRPLPHTRRVTQDAVEELRRVFAEFNALVTKHKIPLSNIHCMDETGMSSSEQDAAHAKVLHRAGSTPFRRVKKCTQKMTLVAMITADGSHLPPAILHPQKDRLQKKQVDAWNNNSGEPNTHHLLVGKASAYMNSYLFYEANRRWQDLMDEGNHVVLMDGHGSHYQPRTMLEGRFERGSDGKRPRPGGNVFYLIYPPNMTGSVSPCDDHACFGALKRKYYTRLSDMGGAKTLEEIHKAAGAAYKDTMTPDHIDKAFLNCGFVTGDEAKQKQEEQIAKLQRCVDAQKKLAEESRNHPIIDELSRRDELGDAAPFSPKDSFGEGGKVVGIVNDNDNVKALVKNMKLRAKEDKKESETEKKKAKAKKTVAK